MHGKEAEIYKSVTIINLFLKIFTLTPAVCLFRCAMDKTEKASFMLAFLARDKLPSYVTIFHNATETYAET